MVFNTLQNLSEHYQLLHHSFVYDLQKSVLIIGDESGTVIQSTIVNYSKELKEDYGKVLKDMKDFMLYWVYNDNEINNNVNNSNNNQQIIPTTSMKKIPDEVVTIAVDQVKMLADKQAIHSSFQLFSQLHSMSLPLPLPSLQHLIPIYSAYWNTAKRGSDTLTKLMDDCILHPPSAHLNCESVAFTRSVMILYTIIHRLIQTFTAKGKNWWQLAQTLMMLPIVDTRL